MCGLLGEITFAESLTEPEIFRDLLKMSVHRGPDDSKVLIGEWYQLGFNRLAIQDISDKGSQPMYSPSTRYLMVFNGEIYNYKDLIEIHRLQNLSSTSDSEVILHLVDLLGVEEGIRQLNGMFAIAILDLKTQELFLSRDFAGIKPLFYAKSDKGVVFASTFSQIYKHPSLNKSLTLRPNIMKEYFCLGYMASPNTIYNNIYQLNPGCLIKIDHQGKLQEKGITRFSNKDELVRFEGDEFKLKFNDLFSKVIKRQLRSDVPIASFLSGGIDSPLVCAFAKRWKPDISAFTLKVNDESLDESEKAIEYASHLKLEQTIESIKEEELIETIDSHFKFMDEPFGDYSSIPTFAISKLARKKHTVMLAGDGGDELFFGYPKTLDIFKKRNWFFSPFPLRKQIARLAIKFNKLDSWAPYYFKGIGDWVLTKNMQILDRNLNQFFKGIKVSSNIHDLYNSDPQIKDRQLLHWLRYNDFYGHLQRVLIKVDRMSMANSLEVRVPFLDKDIIELCWQHIPSLKNNNDLKLTLKQSLSQFIPKKVIEKRKKGFAVPILKWLRGPLLEDLREHTLNKPIYGREFLDERKVKEYVTGFIDKKHNEAWGVWHIYAWQKWADIHLDDTIKRAE